MKGLISCPDCGLKPKQETLDFVSNMEKELGIEVIINSGARCIKHNAEVGGVKESSHTFPYLCAIDLKCYDSKLRFKILKYLLDNGIVRIGIGKSFIHFDTDSTKPQETIWLYP